jgi:GT2 family glycosyltransferase
MAERRPRASVLIVNWNGRAHLADCLDSLAGQVFTDFEVVLVDNGSRDGSVEFVRSRYPQVRLVTLPENTGFAGGNNAGLDRCRGEYIITLNNDTVVDPGWLAELVRVADLHPGAGMVGCRICCHDDPERLDSLGVRVCADGMSRGAFRRQPFAALGCRPVEEILLPSACAALYKRTMLEQTGFFDEAFFAYCEDTDLGLRGRLAGWEAVLATGAVVHHKYSQTGGALSPFKLRLVERNHFWVAVKNFPASLVLLLPLLTLRRYAQQLRAFLFADWSAAAAGPRPSALALIRAQAAGVVDALLGLPGMLAKRGRVRSMQRLAPRDFRRLLRFYRLSFRELFDDAR